MDGCLARGFDGFELFSGDLRYFHVGFTGVWIDLIRGAGMRRAGIRAWGNGMGGVP